MEQNARRDCAGGDKKSTIKAVKAGELSIQSASQESRVLYTTSSLYYEITTRLVKASPLRCFKRPFGAPQRAHRSSGGNFQGFK